MDTHEHYSMRVVVLAARHMSGPTTGYLYPDTSPATLVYDHGDGGTHLLPTDAYAHDRLHCSNCYAADEWPAQQGARYLADSTPVVSILGEPWRTLTSYYISVLYERMAMGGNRKHAGRDINVADIDHQRSYLQPPRLLSRLAETLGLGRKSTTRRSRLAFRDAVASILLSGHGEIDNGYLTLSAASRLTAPTLAKSMGRQDREVYDE